MLSFDAQDAIAEQWRHADAAQWMREYYRHARTVYRAATPCARGRRRRSQQPLSRSSATGAPASPTPSSACTASASTSARRSARSRPELALRLFEFVARHGIRASVEAERRIEARRANCADYFTTPRSRCGPRCRRILSLPHTPLAVRCMHETGLLTAIFPELEQIECLVIRDFYHRYTVDEHTLVTIQNLWSLRDTDEPACAVSATCWPRSRSRRRWCSPCSSTIPAKAAAKATSRRPCATPPRRHARIRMPEADRENVRFLILRHLDSQHAMQSRDLFDPRTIDDVAHQVETVERLSRSPCSPTPISAR